MSNRDDRNRGRFNKPFAQKFQNQSSSNRPPSQHGRNDDRNNEKSLDEVWKDYLKDGYFDDEGNLREELVKRENLQALVKEMAFARPNPLSSNQLRRFFQHCRAVESRVLSKHSNWEKERVAFMQIDSAAADAYGKQDKKIPKIFHDFIQRNVALVKTEKDFTNGFLKHFEALVGFAAQYLEKERK